jgi:predicted CoA-binding protein
VICVQPDKVPEILRQAAAAGIRRVWLQQGAESPAATQLATELGLSLVQGECILMYAPRVRSFHRLHRGLWRLLGRLAVDKT